MVRETGVKLEFHILWKKIDINTVTQTAFILSIAAMNNNRRK